MKNAASYEKKIKKLLKGMAKVTPDERPTGDQAVQVLVESILQADASDKQAQIAIDLLQEEFVDFNELRVSPPKDISDCIGSDFPEGRAKAEMIVVVLNGIYQRTFDIGLDYMADMVKRDLRRHLSELGLGPYPAAMVVMKVFGGHAVPVDETLVEVLKMGRYIGADSGLNDAQGFLVRVITQKNDLSAHEFFRAHVQKSAKALAKKRKAEAEARAKAEAEARAKAEAKEKARKKAEAEKEAKAKQVAKKKAAAKRAAAKKAKKKTVVKKAKTKAAKKATRKPTAKHKKVAKKAHKKAAGRR